MSPDRTVIIGPGRLGLSLAAGLARSNLPGGVTVVGPRPEPPDFLLSRDDIVYVPAPESPAMLAALPAGASLGLLFAVDDDRLEAAADEWAQYLGSHPCSTPPVALHTSGFHAASVLDPLRRTADASTGGWHPLVAVARPAADAFTGITVGIEGSAPAIAWAEAISRELGARPVTIPAGQKARYHAAAVFASNYLVACLGVADAELQAVSDGTVGEAALLPLARAAIENVARHGISGGATGPLVRGDVATVGGHLAALDPSRAALYRALGRELLDLVQRRHAPEVYEALRDALRDE